jgi:hypothetical protein
MSFCKNCGADVGENKFCSVCGTAVNETTQNATISNSFSNYYPQICEYERDAVGIFVFGILSLVCCMGIGIIFEIIAIVKSDKANKKFKNLMINDLLVTNPIEIDKLQNAKSKHKTGGILTSIAIIITSILLVVLFMTVLIALQL